MEEEAAVEEKKEPGVQLEGKMAEFVEWLEGISVLELSHLVKALEDRLGVSAAAPVAIAGPASGDGDAGDVEEAAKTDFDVLLVSPGAAKIPVIKEIRALTTLGLKEAKELVDNAPKPVKEGVPKEEAEEAKAKLEAAGATVEIK